VGPSGDGRSRDRKVADATPFLRAKRQRSGWRVLGRRIAAMIRPKGNLSAHELWILAAIAFLPLLSVAIRSLAFPGVLEGGAGVFQRIGSALQQVFSLSAVPPEQRDHVLYLLFLPTSAMLVALARLTFGLRVLGFRSILISVGFHQSGILPSLLLIAIAVTAIVLLRPWLRRVGLPYYARVSVILCTVAVTMLGALLAGPWMQSDVLWGAAFFPVIVLGMLAEGIADTMDRDNVVTASWRAISTMVLAFLIAFLGWTPALKVLLLQFPELVLTQIVAIVLISEYLDLRLLEGWDQRVAETLMPRLVAKPGSFRVAVVRGTPEPGGPTRVGRAELRREAAKSVRRIVESLRRGGYTVKVLEGDTTLLQQLRRFLPAEPGARPEARPQGIVLDLAHGVRGDLRAAHVPAMLEMSGLPYVGPGPFGHAMAYDRVVSRVLLQESGLPTPASRVVDAPGGEVAGLRYPLAVYPRREPQAKAKIVRRPEQLRDAVRQVIRRYGQDAVIEEHVRGRRISAALVGNAPIRCLPLVELNPVTGTRTCPAVLDESLAKRIRAVARRAFRACDARDYARVDVRVSARGEVRVMKVSTLGILARGGTFVLAGEHGGLPYGRLVRRIVEVARARERPAAPPRPLRLPAARPAPAETVAPAGRGAGEPGAGSPSERAGA
jgi:D-alanine-D-alanine ligase